MRQARASYWRPLSVVSLPSLGPYLDGLCVNCHEIFPIGGQRDFPRMVMSFPAGRRGFPRRGWMLAAEGLDSFAGGGLGQADGVAVVTMTWAWRRSRSTRVVAMVRGMSSSNPDGWRLDEIVTARRS